MQAIRPRRCAHTPSVAAGSRPLEHPRRHGPPPHAAPGSPAEHLGLALLNRPDRLHLAVAPNADIHHDDAVRFHTGRPLAPSTRPLVASLPDLLEHAACCLPPREAHIVWESALRKRLITLHELRRAPWRRAASRRLLGLVDDRSDSLLESLLAFELRERGIAFVQQAEPLDRPVDFLVEGRVVVQLDGYEFHGGARQRRADIEHDARLELRGLPVLRRDFVQVVHRMPETLELLLRRLSLTA